MLNLLDDLITNVLDSGWTATPPPAKPGFFFTVPDDSWRTKVKAGTSERLNVYLYEVRENRDFRRSSWDVVGLADRSAALSHPPVYLDCHYLISAWSPAEDSEAIDPVRDEHLLLSEALRVLLRMPEVTPATLGIAGGGPVFQQARIYLNVAPPETPRVLNDFWSTMKLPWRPAILLVATAPLDLLQDTPLGPLVTTFIQRYAPNGLAGSVEEWIQIGGWVLRNADNAPIAGATVRRVATGGHVLEEVLTDVQGRYTFAGLPRGVQHMHVEAPGMTAIDRDLDLPDAPPEDHMFKLS
jgi:hypothetical protein